MVNFSFFIQPSFLFSLNSLPMCYLALKQQEAKEKDEVEGKPRMAI